MGAANMFFLSTIALSSLFAQTVFSLRVASGSPCWDVCSESSPKNTTGDDIVCRDNMYVDTRVGRRFQECVSCELESTHFLERYDESDVEWGLYNIRYAFSSCIFAYPVEMRSISTPCQVSCESLRDAIKYGITDPDGFTSYDFCNLDSFDDSVVTKCGNCYSATEDEKYLANFIEALRQGCHNRAKPEEPFVLDPTRIFSTARIPASIESPEPDSDDEADGKPDNLVLIIVLPIVGFIVLLALGCCGCCFFVWRRRRRAREQSQATQHEGWNNTSIMTPFPGGLQKLWHGDPAANQPMFPQHQYGAYNPAFYQPEPTPQHGDIKYPPEAHMVEANQSYQQQYQYSQQYQQQYQHTIPPVSQEQYVHETSQTPGGQIQQTIVPIKQDAQVPILSPPPARKSMGANPEKSD